MIPLCVSGAELKLRDLPLESTVYLEKGQVLMAKPFHFLKGKVVQQMKTLTVIERCSANEGINSR